MPSADEPFSAYGSQRPPKDLYQWYVPDDYWFEQRYLAMFLAEHGHELGIPCTTETCRKPAQYPINPRVACTHCGTRATTTPLRHACWGAVYSWLIYLRIDLNDAFATAQRLYSLQLGTSRDLYSSMSNLWGGANPWIQT